MEENKESTESIKAEQQQQQQQTEDPKTHMSILELLKSKSIEYSLLVHEPTRTSEESAKVRGATLASGAKAMLLRDGKTGLYLLAVISASRKLSWKKIRTLLNSKKLNLATEDEVWTLTKCFPGAVPPFGSLFNIQTYCDNSLIQQGNRINFNAGLKTHSLNMATDDFIIIEKPLVTDFCE